MTLSQFSGLLLPLLLLSGCSRDLEVTTVNPQMEPMEESFTEPARTRLPRTYPVTMPLDGRIEEISFKPGDPVKVGERLVAFDSFPLEQTLQEAKAAVQELEKRVVLNEFDDIEQSLRLELVATVDAARDVLKAADAQVDAEQARANRAGKEHERIQKLNSQGMASDKQLDDTAMLAETTTIGLREQELMREAYKTLFTAIQLGPKYIDDWLKRKRIERELLLKQLTQAQARLAMAERNIKLADIVSPINGVVLQRLEQGGGPLVAGQPLLNLGRLDQMEVVAEVLTQDALKLKAGAKVELSARGVSQNIAGEVTLVEPAGFTKRSSLGVEQQRVKVIIALSGGRQALGVGFRLHARFITAKKEQALVIPRFSVLEALDRSHYVLKLRGNERVRQTIKIGMKNDFKIEVLEGLNPEDKIVSTPSSDMSTR
ncbi:MAG: HlyD family efflux transporter periplasmic adaptor subunit [Gammaproteobacteria bacterium]|nr:HlyD family efflux transporter periplasmic adaptor subunit [Gammaproteobacteria bacterium]